MTRTELDRFQAILGAKHAEVARAMGRREGLTIERTADALDEVRFAADRELTGRALERDSTLLRNLRAALDRLAEGTYGTCLQCDEEISQKRLQAMPWATFCIACQESADRNSRQRFVAYDDFLGKAA
ncbi:MAG TPA: TraR/DksA family transcriptional regulator [Bryobacteraceae bacterium]|nr:TraR/DksA family transcriptional regulator [Bryobacteraceae bacterium]